MLPRILVGLASHNYSGHLVYPLEMLVQYFIQSSGTAFQDLLKIDVNCLEILCASAFKTFGHKLPRPADTQLLASV